MEKDAVDSFNNSNRLHRDGTLTSCNGWKWKQRRLSKRKTGNKNYCAHDGWRFCNGEPDD